MLRLRILPQQQTPPPHDKIFALHEIRWSEEWLHVLKAGVNGDETCYIPPDIRGQEHMMIDGRSLRDHLTDVCLAVKKVFNTKVRSTPARVTPMRLEVDEAIWHDPANALGPRQHSPAKQAEVHRQVQKMLPLGVIGESQAPYYSQVHLTPKPTPGEWRCFIGYRPPNHVNPRIGGGLRPNVGIGRGLGLNRAKIFF